MKTIQTILLAAVTLSACTTSSVREKINITGRWRIERAMGIEAIENSPAFINFAADGTLNGNATVNVFSGAYSISEHNLSFDDIATTQMMGEGIEVEDAVFKALHLTKTVSVTARHAYLLDSKADTVLWLVR